MSSISYEINDGWIQTIVKLCFYDEKFIENAHNKTQVINNCFLNVDNQLS